MFEIGLSYIRQHEDTTEWGADEPYVIIFAADLADTGFIPIPAAKTTLNGPYEMGEVVGFPVSPAHPAKAELCWGFNGQPRDIDHPDNPLILVALMESDHVDSPPDFANSVRAGTDGVVLANLIGHIADRNAGTMSLAELRSQLIDDMRGASTYSRKPTSSMTRGWGRSNCCPSPPRTSSTSIAISSRRNSPSYQRRRSPNTNSRLESATAWEA